MKQLLAYGITLLAGLLLTACEYDNYAPPQSNLKGRLVYKGEPIGVEYNNVTFELWEPGWQKRLPITITVDQDGSYSALLFNATYKMVIPPAQGPFRTIQKDNSDTTTFALNGSQTMDIEVMPYYMLRNAKLSVASRKVTGTASLEKIITDANARTIERVSLYVSKTQFVDGRTSIVTRDLTGTALNDLSNLSLSVDVPTMSPTQSFAYARIGVKIAGVEDMLFSPVQKIQL